VFVGIGIVSIALISAAAITYIGIEGGCFRPPTDLGNAVTCSFNKTLESFGLIGLIEKRGFPEY
jgi:hypothetical protein